MEGTIDRFENDLAVVILDNGQQIDVPVKDLPVGVEEGSHLVIIFSDAKEAEAHKSNEARKLLNDLLKNNSK